MKPYLLVVLFLLTFVTNVFAQKQYSFKAKDINFKAELGWEHIHYSLYLTGSDNLIVSMKLPFGDINQVSKGEADKIIEEIQLRIASIKSINSEEIVQINLNENREFDFSKDINETFTVKSNNNEELKYCLDKKNEIEEKYLSLKAKQEAFDIVINTQASKEVIEEYNEIQNILNKVQKE